ncbi:MAG: hypothetical protein RMI30_03270 [Thermodesulfovibrio sp.]|nr:hypothetical protein [Thermodesulfovibrio sp.]
MVIWRGFFEFLSEKDAQIFLYKLVSYGIYGERENEKVMFELRIPAEKVTFYTRCLAKDIKKEVSSLNGKGKIEAVMITPLFIEDVPDVDFLEMSWEEQKV